MRRRLRPAARLRLTQEQWTALGAIRQRVTAEIAAVLGTEAVHAVLAPEISGDAGVLKYENAIAINFRAVFRTPPEAITNFELTVVPNTRPLADVHHETT